jgi:hypothetical protein
MRKEYDFSGGVRGRVVARGRGRRIGSDSVRRRVSRDDPDDDLPPAQIRKLQRRVADLEDPIRYLLVSEMGPRFALYYNVSEDVYAMNDPRGATLFKRRNAALAVKRLLGRGIRVVRCNSKRVDGVRVPVLPRRSRRRRKGDK